MTGSSGVSPRGRTVIADDLRRLPKNLHKIDPKSILQPRYAFEWTTLAGAIADAIEGGDESLLPTPTRPRPSPEP